LNKYTSTRLLQKRKSTAEGRFQPTGIGMSGGLDFGRFILGAQAPGAQVKVLRLAIDNDAGGMYIGCPAPVGMAFGVTDIRTDLRCFAA
jgi:hypothetical protein